MSGKVFIFLISLLSIFIIYMLILVFIEKFNSKKYIERIKNISFKSKISSVSKIQKLKLFIIDSCKISHDKIISPSLVIIVSIVLSIICFILCYKLLHIFSSALIISIYSLFIPIFILRYVRNYNKEKLFKEFPVYLSTLKNYTKTQNDIINAFRNCSAPREIEAYIKDFVYQVENGIKVYDAFENMKISINIEKISEFITLLEYCYLNGGDFTNLIDKYSIILTKITIQNEEQKQKEMSTKVVLVVLIIINLYMLFGFVYTNELYRNVIINTFFGRLIIDINILSYFIMIFVFSKFKKMEG